MKTCSKCKEIKELSEFHNRVRASDGRNSTCKSCISARDKDSYLKNQDRILERQANYDKSHKEELKTYRKLYYDSNKDRFKAYHVEHRAENLSYYKVYRVVNRLRLLEYSRLYREAHPSNWSTIDKNKSVRLEVTHKVRPIILERDKFTCVICGIQSELIIHHILPVSQASQLVLDPTNLVTLCRRCHIQKAHSGHFTKLDPELVTILTRYVADHHLVS